MKSMRMVLLALLSLMAISAHGVIETYEFASADHQQRFKALIAELRCPKCQNQNLADSNSEISVDLRAEVYRLIGEGADDEQIVAHLVARYGDFVRYKPPVDQHTVWLWLAPALMLVVGLIIAFIVVRNNRITPTETAATLSAAEREQLNHLTRGQR